jgi:outer membrane receptor protein involved in Fe transport
MTIYAECVELAKNGFHLDGVSLKCQLIALVAGTCALTQSVWAQTVSPSAASGQLGALQEVIVTAQRREESIQQTPISVTVLTGQVLQDFDVKDFQDYAKSVADLSFGMGGSPFGGPAYGFSSTREIVIRGVSGANTTSLYIDDTPIPNVIDPRVLDLARIEVLRGPQGTLFGASSMGGTVRLITQTPDTVNTSGNLRAQAFDINAGGAGYDVSGTLNAPLSTGVTLRLSGFDLFDPGYFKRIFGVPTVPGVAFQPGQEIAGSVKIGQSHEYGTSASMLIKPPSIEGLTITPMIILQRSNTNGYPVADNDPSNFTQIRPLNVPEGTGDRWQFYALTAKYAATLGQLVSSTSYLHRYAYDTEDGTTWFAQFQSFFYSPLPYIASPVPQTYDSEQATEELRFESLFPGPVQLVTGVFYQRSTLAYIYNYLTPGANALSGGVLGSDDSFDDHDSILLKQLAGFADVTYKVGRSLEFSAGVRKARLDLSTNETIIQYPLVNGNSSYSYSDQESPLTPRFVTKYNLDENNMIYGSASKGFRIGGVSSPAYGACTQDAINLGLPVGVPIPYHSDSLWSYELGLKNRWNDQRVATRFAVYDIDWKNIQQNLVLPTCGQGEELNAGAAKIVGAEAEVQALVTSAFRLDGGIGYEDGKITQADILKTGAVIGFPVGAPLSNVPKWTVYVRPEFTKPTSRGEYFVRAEYNFVGTSLSLANGGAGLYRAAYSLVDLRTGLRTSPWNFTLFAKNLFNKAANFGDIVTDVGVIPGQARLAVAQPRTVGVEIRRDFGALQ